MAGNITQMLRSISAGLIIFSFFLPWFQDPFFGYAKLSAFDFMKLFGSEEGILYLLILVPLSSFVVIIKRDSRVLSFIAGLIPLLIIAFFFMLAVSEMEVSPVEFFGIGCYITIVCSVLLIFSSFFKVQKDSFQTPTFGINQTPVHTNSEHMNVTGTEKRAFCSNCGQKVTAGASFCFQCGYKI